MPENLKSQLGPGRGFNSAAVERADAAVAVLGSDYEARMLADLEQLEEAFRVMKTAGRFDVPALYRRVADIRSEGGSYDFPLLTEYADSLANYLDRRQAIDQAGVNVVETHLTALAAVAKNRLRGIGGETAREIGASLRQMVGTRRQ